MNENLIRQLYFSLQISKDLPEDVRMQLKKRIEDGFYFVSSGGKADLDHPISEELLEKTRRLFLENNLPVTAGKISSPKFFLKIVRLADEKRISFETLMVYLFGKAIPFFDKRNTAFFNALSDEKDKKILLQWLIGKYQALEDAEIQTVFDDPESVVLKTSDGESEPLYSVLYLEKNLDFLKTDLPEKTELLDVKNRIRERAKKAQ